MGVPLKGVLLFIPQFCGKNQDIEKVGNPSRKPYLKKMFIGHY